MIRDDDWGGGREIEDVYGLNTLGSLITNAFKYKTKEIHYELNKSICTCT